MMRLSLKILWITVAILILSICIALSLWNIPAPQIEIHKNIPLETFKIT